MSMCEVNRRQIVAFHIFLFHSLYVVTQNMKMTLHFIHCPFLHFCTLHFKASPIQISSRSVNALWRKWFHAFWSAKLWSAFYPHVRTHGPQISVCVLPVDGPQICILHVPFDKLTVMYNGIVTSWLCDNLTVWHIDCAFWWLCDYVCSQFFCIMLCRNCESTLVALLLGS